MQNLLWAMQIECFLIISRVLDFERPMYGIKSVNGDTEKGMLITQKNVFWKYTYCAVL